MRWGLLPAWVKDPRQFTLLINARAETVLEKPAFKNAMKRRRCLLPADGYYEWQGSGKTKQPVFIYPRDRQPFGFAGLMETWLGQNGEELDTVAIVTTAAATDLAVLHHRVPVTIPPGNFDRWLDAPWHSREAATLLAAPTTLSLGWLWGRVGHMAGDVAAGAADFGRRSRRNLKSQAKPARKAASRKPAPASTRRWAGVAVWVSRGAITASDPARRAASRRRAFLLVVVERLVRTLARGCCRAAPSTAVSGCHAREASPRPRS